MVDKPNYLNTFLAEMEQLKEERQKKIDSGELIQPVEFDPPSIIEEDVVPLNPDPDIEDNSRMKLLNERWKKAAINKHPDDIKAQNEFIKKQRERNQTEKEYLTQVVGGVFDAGNSALNFTVNRFLDEDSKILLPEIEFVEVHNL